MGWMDSIKSTVGEAVGSASASALPGIINQVYPGGMQGLLAKLQQSGYGEKVNSWLGKGPNEPINPEDLRNAIGEEHLQMIQDKLGIPADKVLDTLAKALPAAVDHQSPDGQVPPHSDAPA